MNVKHLQEMYDKIAENFDYDEFQLLFDTRNIVIKQIQTKVVPLEVNEIIDLALGTGETLLRIKEMLPKANLYGIDISENMINIAKQKLEINAFHDIAENVGKYVQNGSMDLTLIHFLLAYVNPEVILAQANQILRKGGFCSIATSTWQSLKTLQTFGNNFMSKEAMREKAKIPENAEAIKFLLEAANFKIIDTNVFTKKVEFADFKSLYNWGTKSGWLTQFFLNVSEEQLKTLSVEDFFPMEDEVEFTIILAQKV